MYSEEDGDVLTGHVHIKSQRYVANLSTKNVGSNNPSCSNIMFYTELSLPMRYEGEHNVNWMLINDLNVNMRIIL